MKTVHAHESSSDHAELPRKPAVIRPADSGAYAMALTPDSLLRLQRTAGNAAVVSALAVQRARQQHIDDGMIHGAITLDGKDHADTTINIGDGWISPYPYAVPRPSQ